MHEAARPAALSEDRLIRRLVKLVTELDLDRRDFVIFGSGPLLAHGLRQCIRDLDVVARGTVWRCISQHGVPAAGTINGAPMAQFWGQLIQFSPGWISEDWDTDDLIDRAEIIHGLPFAQLTDVLAYKQALDRPKDRPDIEALLRASAGPGSIQPVAPSGPNPGVIASHAPATPWVREFDPSELLNSRRTGIEPFYCRPGMAPG
jgi:hypothetical protein